MTAAVADNIAQTLIDGAGELAGDIRNLGPSLRKAAQNAWFEARPSDDVIISDTLFSKAFMVAATTTCLAKRNSDGTYDVQRRDSLRPDRNEVIQAGISLDEVWDTFAKEINTVEFEGQTRVLQSGESLGSLFPHNASDYVSVRKPELLDAVEGATHYTEHAGFKGFRPETLEA